jgi:iron complex transport system ATP-binding protein
VDLTVLDVQDLSTGYAHRTVSEHVSFSVARGEVVCLLGPNGSGKTTLFKTLAGTLRPRGGALSLDSQNLSAMGANERARRIAYVPQSQPPPFPYLAIDAVALGRLPHLGLFQAPGPRDRDAALAALEQVGAAHLAPRPLTELSGGERQRILLARALAQGGELLLLDEPTAHLDFGQAHRALSLVRDLADRGRAVLWTTHDPLQALRWADRAVLLHEGGLHSQGAPETILDAAAFRDVFGLDARLHSTRDPHGHLHHHCHVEDLHV